MFIIFLGGLGIKMTDINIIDKKISNEETNNYFKKFYDGDFEAREKIIEGNIFLVKCRVARFMQNNLYDINDLMSIGLIGLIKSVDTFDINKNISFSTYASHCIDNEILMALRKINRNLFDERLDRNICDTETLGSLIEDKNSYVQENYIDKEINEVVRKIVYNLREIDRETILLYFGFIDNNPWNQKQIAQYFNVSQSYISRILHNALIKIKDALIAEEIFEKDVVILKRK